MKIMCECCGRQIVSYPISDPFIVGGAPPIRMGVSSFCCQECGQDLDENGLFPEEREGEASNE
jgi:hypothetical protein